MHGSVHGWHPDRGDFGGVITALLDAGTAAPEAEPDGTDAVREAWRQWRKRR